MWTETEDKTLLDMWAAGAKGGEIATALNRTRSMIMGRISRLRLAGIEVTARPRSPRKKRVYVSQRKVKIPPKILIKAAVQRAMEMPVIPERTVDEVPYRNPCDITELRFFSCRYIVQEKPTLYCNNIIHKHSYCDHHFRLCYQAGTNVPLAAKPRPAYRNS